MAPAAAPRAPARPRRDGGGSPSRRSPAPRPRSRAGAGARPTASPRRAPPRHQRRRGDRERLAEHPRRAARGLHDRARDQDHAHVEGGPVLAAPYGQNRRRPRRITTSRTAPSDEGRRPSAEVAARPNPGELPAADRLEQVAVLFRVRLPFGEEPRRALAEKAMQARPTQARCRSRRQQRRARRGRQDERSGTREGRAPYPHDREDQNAGPPIRRRRSGALHAARHRDRERDQRTHLAHVRGGRRSSGTNSETPSTSTNAAVISLTPPHRRTRRGAPAVRR